MLGSADKHKHDHAAPNSVISPETRTVTDAKFADAIADRFMIAEIATAHPNKAFRNGFARNTVFQTVKPFTEFRCHPDFEIHAVS